MTPCNLCAFPRYLHNKAKSNRTILISLSLVLLLCFSYLEIFFVHRHQKFSSKHGRRFRELSHNQSANRSLLSRRVYAHVGRENATKPPLYRTATSGAITFTTRGNEKIVVPPEQTGCSIQPSFRSIRWTVNWKWNLSSRYAELVKGLRADNEISFENLDIPKWQVEIKKQKYIVAASFQPIISEMEYKILMETFYTLAEALHAANLTFFLYGGSHLGVYRHHGIVPWDDDVDVMLDSSQREKARSVLSNIPYYSLYSPDGHQWKFFESSLTTIIHKPYRWPFIDIFFFAENSTHIWDELPLYKNEFSYRKCDVFPLVYRPFEGGFVPVPRNSEETLQRSYNNNICKSNTYWHKFESYAPRSRKKIIRCSVIQEMFPFVFRSCAYSNCLKEELKRVAPEQQQFAYPTWSFTTAIGMMAASVMVGGQPSADLSMCDREETQLELTHSDCIDERFVGHCCHSNSLLHGGPFWRVNSFLKPTYTFYPMIMHGNWPGDFYLNSSESLALYHFNSTSLDQVHDTSAYHGRDILQTKKRSRFIL